MHTTFENVPSSVAGPTADSLQNQSTFLQSQSPKNKAVVVGLYGVPGSGKTFLLSQLRQSPGSEHFAFYEGSEVIANLVPGGLGEFQKLEEPEKQHWRGIAIENIGKECASNRLVAVVAGHFMFWPEKEAECPVYTAKDLLIYTHILYMDVPPKLVAQRRLDDIKRSRPSTSVDHLLKWQQAEKTQLRNLCHRHGILYTVVSSHLMPLNKILTLLDDFRQHTEEYNLSQAEKRLEEVLIAGEKQLETVLVMDADRTLAAEDTGALFWERVSQFQATAPGDSPLKSLFSSSLGYSYKAFRQATLLYEETANDQEFDDITQDVASAVTMYPEFVSLLQMAAKQKHVGAVIISCGLRRVWEKVLEREGLSETVKVIGGGRIADGFVVTAAVKAALVARLQDKHQLYVWAFGDSPLDLPMLGKAEEAIVVVGEERTRSKTMDMALMNAIDNNGLRARQAVLPHHASPRLDTTRLPLVQLIGQEFVDSILCRRSQHASVQVLHATEKSAAKLLMTPMRDANVAGPSLRGAHQKAGRYLATEFLADVIGIEEYSIPHVQGYNTSGYRLLREQHTLIVALMRGGEPMALGVNEAFPLATFVHAKEPAEMRHHLQGRSNIVLVDSVVNSGKTVVQFVQYIRNLYPTIPIVVVTGVAQAESISVIEHEFPRERRLSLIALRLSANKFTGKGTTDTGNRLFNTTHML